MAYLHPCLFFVVILLWLLLLLLHSIYQWMLIKTSSYCIILRLEDFSTHRAAVGWLIHFSVHCPPDPIFDGLILRDVNTSLFSFVLSDYLQSMLLDDTDIVSAGKSEDGAFKRIEILYPRWHASYVVDPNAKPCFSWRSIIPDGTLRLRIPE